jgi:succinate dehydrogenase/fumarate reductase flavoprotein subunit
MAETRSVDLLVIGGGLAGLSAALEARERSLEVALVCKSKAGKSGNTLVSGGALSVVSDFAGYDDSPSILEKDLLNSGAGINDNELVKLFARESTSVLPFLEKYGVKFKSFEGKPMVKHPPGHSVRRSFPSEYRNYSYLNRGLALTLPLLDQAKRRGVRIVDETTVIRLLTDEEGICGAVAMANSSGGKMRLRAKAVILAAGGGAGLYEKNNNTADVSCDSYRLAYEAGAVMRDMEMVQFYPSMMYSPIKMPLSNPLFGDGAVLKNNLGEEFMYRYSDRGNLATRDIMARAVMTEIEEGRGNPEYVYMDCSKIDSEVLDKKYQELRITLKKAGLDIKKDLLPLAPAAHFYIGGIEIDRDCRTSVEGLLACGEAAGGLHGANRLSGIALAETVVFGKIAGRTASKICRKREQKRNLPELEEEVPEIRHGESVIPDLIKGIRTLMWKNASIKRNEGSLKTASDELDRIIKLKESAKIEGPRDHVLYHQLESMIVAAQMLLCASFKRLESRGAFCRTDYPEIDNSFRGNFFLKKDPNGKMECTFRRSE